MPRSYIITEAISRLEAFEIYFGGRGGIVNKLFRSLSPCIPPRMSIFFKRFPVHSLESIDDEYDYVIIGMNTPLGCSSIHAHESLQEEERLDAL